MHDLLKNVPVGAICRSDELPRLYQVVEHQQLLTVVRLIGTDATTRLWSRIEVSVIELPGPEDDEVEVAVLAVSLGAPVEVSPEHVAN